MIFDSAFDNLSSTIKAKLAGFHDRIDTEDMLQSFFPISPQTKTSSLGGGMQPSLK